MVAVCWFEHDKGISSVLSLRLKQHSRGWAENIETVNFAFVIFCDNVKVIASEQHDGINAFVRENLNAIFWRWDWNIYVPKSG